MKHIVRCVIILIIVGLGAVPALAAELRVTGFFDNVFPHFESNLSSADLWCSDTTRGTITPPLGAPVSRLFQPHRQR